MAIKQIPHFIIFVLIIHSYHLVCCHLREGYFL